MIVLGMQRVVVKGAVWRPVILPCRVILVLPQKSDVGRLG